MPHFEQRSVGEFGELAPERNRQKHHIEERGQEIGHTQTRLFEAEHQNQLEDQVHP